MYCGIKVPAVAMLTVPEKNHHCDLVVVLAAPVIEKLVVLFIAKTLEDDVEVGSARVLSPFNPV